MRLPTAALIALATLTTVLPLASDARVVRRTVYRRRVVVQQPTMAPQPTGPANPPAVPAQDARTEAVERDAFARVNAVRRQRGLPALAPDDALDRIARAHSRAMATEHFFDHRDRRGRSAGDRFRAASVPFSFMAENIFMSGGVPEPAAEAVSSWMRSSGHRANILNRQPTRSGMGVWRLGEEYYFTQVFHRSQ